MIYIDMDGVLVDFIGGMFRLLEMKPYRLTYYDEIVDISGGREQFWKKINSKKDFWIDLQQHQYAKRLVNECLKLDQVYLLTFSQNNNLNLIAGKIEWVRLNFPRLNVIFKDNKGEIARIGDVLIDDYPKNIEDWPGKGILYPRSWNTRNCETEYYCFVDVIKQLKDFKENGI